MPAGLSITSVFDLAFAGLTLREPMPQGTRHPHRRIERGEGVTRYRQVEEQDTEAYKEREIQRRARQIVPRPPKAAKAYWSQFADGQPKKADKVGSAAPQINIVINNTAAGTRATASYDDKTRTVQIAVAEVASQISNNSGQVWTALRSATNVRSAL